MAYIYIEVAGQYLAMGHREVLQVGRIKDYTVFPIPHSKVSCLGCLQVRGKMIPLVDGMAFFEGTDQERHATNTSQRFIIVNTPMGPVAATVDRVQNDAEALPKGSSWRLVRMNK